MRIASQVASVGLLDKNAVKYSRQMMIMPDEALFYIADKNSML